MTKLEVSDNAKRMGRPTLKHNIKTQATMVRLTKDVHDRIKALVGDRRMATFIREAVDNELKRRERQKPDPKE